MTSKLASAEARQSRAPITAVALALLSSCAAAGIPLQQYRTGSMPQYGDVATAEVGAPVYAEFQYLATLAAILPSGFTWNSGTWLNTGPTSSVILPPGYGLVGQTVNGQVRYCTPDAQLIDAVLGPTNVVCFHDREDDGSFDEMLELLAFGVGRIPIAPTPYKKGILTDIDGFKKEVVYQGAEGKRFKFTYREYVNTVAHPSVTEEATYDLTPHTVIAVRGAKIEVVDADAQHISYRVLGGFM